MTHRDVPLSREERVSTKLGSGEASPRLVDLGPIASRTVSSVSWGKPGKSVLYKMAQQTVSHQARKDS